MLLTAWTSATCVLHYWKYYRKHIQLFIKGESILSQEGTTLEDPLAMYAVAITLLIHRLPNENIKQAPPGGLVEQLCADRRQMLVRPCSLWKKTEIPGYWSHFWRKRGSWDQQSDCAIFVEQYVDEKVSGISIC